MATVASESAAAADRDAANPTAREAIFGGGGGGRGGVVAVVLRAAGVGRRLQGTLKARIHYKVCQSLSKLSRERALEIYVNMKGCFDVLPIIDTVGTLFFLKLVPAFTLFVQQDASFRKSFESFVPEIYVLMKGCF